MKTIIIELKICENGQVSRKIIKPDGKHHLWDFYSKKNYKLPSISTINRWFREDKLNEKLKKSIKNI